MNTNRGRTSCGCGDLNSCIEKATISSTVAPLTGAWIEILKLLIHRNATYVAPLVGAGIEIP
ncbi:hypothetical protein [Bacillus sp. SRB_331]|uniref:hypothetical protein n=1 Tax=Bacillus sp. SRB_331 TaxID=1969379 RepID=UPI0011581CA9|nr:hypothetical protein [Bacillus sp. SRB_331]